jgi:ectoine hydroxylase-related dioxygenase (phytanoyl-CoA dioxygenase family)
VDYTEEKGALAMVPGSHRLHRQPVRGETALDGPERNPHAIPMEIPAGSAVVWHGNTWHGSFPRKVPGLRLNLATYFCREYIVPQEAYRGNVPEGFVEQGEERLATLLGGEIVHGWKDEGPSEKFYSRRTRRMRSLYG